jgi:hypothetical protein
MFFFRSSSGRYLAKQDGTAAEAKQRADKLATELRRPVRVEDAEGVLLFLAEPPAQDQEM